MYCVKCGNQMAATDRFCTNCGTPAGASGKGQRRGQTDGENQNYTIHRFAIPKNRHNDLVNRIAGFLRVEKYDVQVMPLPSGGTAVQAAKRGSWRRILGIRSATTVIVEAGETATTVRIGAGKWLEKAVTGAVGLIWFPPLALTTGLGVYEQSQLPGKIFRVVDQFAKEK